MNNKLSQLIEIYTDEIKRVEEVMKECKVDSGMYISAEQRAITLTEVCNDLDGLKTELEGE